MPWVAKLTHTRKCQPAAASCTTASIVSNKSVTKRFVGGLFSDIVGKIGIMTLSVSAVKHSTD